MVRTLISTILIAGMGLSTSAYGHELICTSEDSALTVSVTKDGGEETMVIANGSENEKYLVLFRDAGKIVAMNDSALGNPSNRGAILSLKTYGKNYLSYNGDILVLECQ